MLVNFLNHNINKTSSNQNRTYNPKIQNNNYQKDVFEKNIKVSFKGNPKILLFDDIAKFIKNGDLEFIEKLQNPYIINQDLKSLLHISAEEKQFEISKHLLGRGFNINQKDARGKTPFSIACLNKDEPTINLFLEHHPDINTQDELGNTPLHNAIPSKKILGILLDRGAIQYKKDVFGLTVLHAASEDLDTVEYLLKKGVSPNLINDEEQTLMHTAVLDGNIKLADTLINYGADINFRDKKGKSPLFYANNAETLKYLIEKGAKIEIPDQKGKTALHNFVINRDFHSISTLLKYEANPNSIDKSNKSPILYVTNNAIRKLLLMYGANPDIKTSKGETLLHLAAQKNNEEVINTLLSYRADPNILDKNKHAALYYATNNKIRRILLAYGANPNEDAYLHQSLQINNTEFFDDLLKSKADVNFEDFSGKTPIFYCKNPEDLIKLAAKKADINHPDKNGNRPLHQYAAIGDTEMVNLLVKIGADARLRNNNFETPYELMEKSRQYAEWIK